MYIYMKKVQRCVKIQIYIYIHEESTALFEINGKNAGLQLDTTTRWCAPGHSHPVKSALSHEHPDVHR